MSTISREFTKEQLIAKAREQIEFCRNTKITGEGRVHVNQCLALFEIALASLEAEPVGTFRNGPCGYSPSFHEDAVPLYTAPPAPVALPSGYSDFEEIWSSSTHPLTQDDEMKDFAWDIWNACRAAMLQGAEPVTTAYKLRDAVETIRNSGIAIDAEKILAECDAFNAPDCWCRTCRPVTMTDMRFVVCPDCGNKRCPHANDHRHECTGSNEPGQEGSAYPAAPKQEAK